MGILGGRLAYEALRWIRPVVPQAGRDVPENFSDPQLTHYFGENISREVQGRTVMDFGCGYGVQSLELARLGAERVLGVDILEARLAVARQSARKAGLDHKCEFVTKTEERVDVVISKDAFEHFDDPAAILQLMASHLKPEGYVLASFGPTWLHPYGGHLFSVFPWSHLIFTEASQIRWRSDFRSDGATCFREVEGGLNQMTIRRFRRLVQNSPLQFRSFETVPIRGLSLLRLPGIREFGSSIVRCRLVPRR